jgi:hypothetical protein
MKTLTAIIFGLFMVINCSAAETVFRGYIINKNGQRIDGQIKTKNVTVDEIKIMFIEGQTKIIYKPTDLIGYGYEFLGENEFGEVTSVWRNYKAKTAISLAPKFYAPKEVFMEVMEEGEVALYDYYVETPGNIENPYTRFFYMERQGSNELIEVSEDNFITVVGDYFADDSEITQNIGTVNNKFRHLWKIVRLYNDRIEMEENKDTRMVDFETTSSEIAPF